MLKIVRCSKNALMHIILNWNSTVDFYYHYGKNILSTEKKKFVMRILDLMVNVMTLFSRSSDLCEDE